MSTMTQASPSLAATKATSILITPHQHARRMLEFNRKYGQRPDGTRAQVTLDDGKDFMATTRGEAWLNAAGRALVHVVADGEQEAKAVHLANVKPL